MSNERSPLGNGAYRLESTEPRTEFEYRGYDCELANEYGHWHIVPVSDKVPKCLRGTWTGIVELKNAIDRYVAKAMAEAE